MLKLSGSLHGSRSASARLSEADMSQNIPLGREVGGMMTNLKDIVITRENNEALIGTLIV